MPSNSNNNDATQKPTNEKKPEQEEQEQTPTPVVITDFESVTRSIEAINAQVTQFHLRPDTEVDIVPPLPTAFPADTICTSFDSLNELTPAIFNFFNGQSTVDCLADTSSTSFYGIQYHQDQTSVSFTTKVYRDEINSKLHLEVNRLEGCGIKFAQFYAAIADEFSSVPMNIWTFEQPELLPVELVNFDEYDDIPLYSSQSCLVDGQDVILPCCDDDDTYDVPSTTETLGNMDLTPSPMTSPLSNSNACVHTTEAMSNVDWALNIINQNDTHGPMLIQALEVLSTSLDGVVPTAHQLQAVFSTISSTLQGFMTMDISLRLKLFVLLSKLSQINEAVPLLLKHLPAELIFLGLQLNNEECYEEHMGDQPVDNILQQLMLREMFRCTYSILSAIGTQASGDLQRQYKDWARAIISSANNNSARDQLIYSSY